jgi:hypothetical protein
LLLNFAFNFNLHRYTSASYALFLWHCVDAQSEAQQLGADAHSLWREFEVGQAGDADLDHLQDGTVQQRDHLDSP